METQKIILLLRKIVLSSRFSGNTGKAKGGVGMFVCYPYWNAASYLIKYLHELSLCNDICFRESIILILE